MLRDLRRDPAFPRLGIWIGMAFTTSSLFWSIVLFRSTRSASGSPLDVESDLGIFGAIVWVILGIFLIFGGGRTRCRQLELTLPISVRLLWTRHLLAVLLAALGLLLTATSVVPLHGLAYRVPTPLSAGFLIWLGMNSKQQRH